MDSRCAMRSVVAGGAVRRRWLDAEVEGGEVDRGLALWGLGGCERKFGFYSNWSGTPLETTKQKRSVVRFILLKNYSDENGWRAARVKAGNLIERCWLSWELLEMSGQAWEKFRRWNWQPGNDRLHSGEWGEGIISRFPQLYRDVIHWDRVLGDEPSWEEKIGFDFARISIWGNYSLSDVKYSFSVTETQPFD